MDEQQHDREGLENIFIRIQSADEKERPVKKIEELRQRVNNGETITLLCYCKKGQHCHRDIIKSMIEGQLPS